MDWFGAQWIVPGAMASLGLWMVLDPARFVELINLVNDGVHRFRSRLQWPGATLAPEPAPDSPGMRNAIRAVGASVVVLVLILFIDS